MRILIAFLTRFFVRLFMSGAVLLLVACGDSANTTTQPDLSHDLNDPAAYNGPAPATADVAAFKQFLWNNIAVANRCGGCHGTGGQSPQFARDDDINLAYAAANTIVDLANPGASHMVVKVGGGHNCWDVATCRDVMALYITNWANSTVGGPAATVKLVEPPLAVPGQTKNFPPSSALFAANVHPLLTEYCSNCHTPTATKPQAPYFAQANVDAAYAAARNSINLNDTTHSRLVLRLGSEFHNCWDDCAANAAEMLAAINVMAGAITPTPLPGGTIASHALGLRQGIIASGGGRHDENVIAKYEFKEGQGNIAHDSSGITPSLDLTLSGNYDWVGGWGIHLFGGKAQASTLNSKAKLHKLLTSSGEYSIEAWVAPANVTQEGPARIVSYSGGPMVRNFTLGQTMFEYNVLNRHSNADANGMPTLSTDNNAKILQATLQHVVVTFTATAGRKLFVNGQLVASGGGAADRGTLANWDDTFALVLGSEVDGSNHFDGVIRMLAIHSRALPADQIQQNFDAGVGERFFMLFDVGHLLTPAQSLYVLFEGSQFDNYSYLLAAPRLVSLDPDFVPNGIPVAGMRLGINGHVVGFNQAFQKLDTVSDASTWIPGAGDELSRLGAIIPLENGPDFDQMFLTFDRFGSYNNVTVEDPVAPTSPVAGDPQPQIGIRLFETINAALANITTVPPETPSVQDMYDRVQQQLPASDAIEGFSAAQQIGITQLAIEYCNTLVDDPLSSIYFAGFNLNAPFTSAFNTPAQRSALIDPLLLHVANTNLLTMPDMVDMQTELNDLVDRLSASCTGTCTTQPIARTQTIAKAVCTAATANAAMLLE